MPVELAMASASCEEGVVTVVSTYCDGSASSSDSALFGIASPLLLCLGASLSFSELQ